jgi:hypothetical protein
LSHELLLRFEVGIRIQPWNKVAVPLEEPGRENASTQIRLQPFKDCTIGQIGLLQDLSARPRVLGKETFKLDHQTSLFIDDFEDLVS